MSDEVTPFRIEVSEAELRELRERLERSRWSGRETVEDWWAPRPLRRLHSRVGLREAPGPSRA